MSCCTLVLRAAPCRRYPLMGLAMTSPSGSAPAAVILGKLSLGPIFGRLVSPTRHAQVSIRPRCAIAMFVAA